MSFLWRRNGDTRGKGRTLEIYYRGEWISKKADVAIVKGDRVTYKQVANPDYRKAARIAKRRGNM